MNHELELQKALIKLLIEQPFYSILAMNLVLEERPEFPTFATDGRNLFWSKEAIDTLGINNLPYVLIHEVLHCVDGHIWRKGERNHMAWNIACDLELAHQITQYTRPKFALFRKEDAGRNAEWIYETLPKENISDGQGKDKQKEKEGNNPLEGDILPASKGTSQESWIGKTIAAAETIERQRGDIPGDIQELIDRIKKVRINFKDVLRSVLTSRVGTGDYRYMPPNKKALARGFILSGMRREELEAVIAIDTSGSISQEELSEFWGITEAVAEHYGSYKLQVFTCDTKIQQELLVTEGEELPSIAMGRGGTDFRPVFKRCEELGLSHLPLVYLTDLQGIFPNSSLHPQVLWVIPTSAVEQEVPFGLVTRLLVEGNHV